MLSSFFYFRIPVVLLALFVSATSQVVAQVQNVGNITHYKKIPGGIHGKTATAFFEIRAYSPNVIRVRVSKNDTLQPFSYALVSNDIPSFNDDSISEENGSIRLSTSAMSLDVEQQPAFRVCFRNKRGDVINEDVKGQGFGTTFTGNKVTVYKKLQPGERFVGLGEALGNLDRRGTGVTLNNTDNYRYGDPRISMYSSIPFYIGIHNNLLYGIFYNNSYKSFFNFGLSTPGFSSASMEGGDADYFLIYDTTVDKIIRHYTSLTGRMPLPPAWSLGYHQSRCSYYPQQKVQWLAETFRDKKIPVDCIVLDADYLYEYEPFRIDTERFPHMPELAKNLNEMGIELTASVNPGIKIDTSYEAYKDGLGKDVFVKYVDGSVFTSDIAPSTNHFVDFTKPSARAWWIDHMKFLPDNGIHGFWNDMNEPAVNGSYLPDNLVFDFDGRKSGAMEAKNVYGFLMARSSFEAAKKYGGDRRPFVLSRAGFAGIQRYAAIWSGDNTAKDEYLLNGILLNSQLGLSGIPFVGYDVGGYIGDASKELFIRWMEAGTFSPFFRNHREFFGAAGEPWAYGEEAEAISKNYINLRYRLLPYTYAAFYHASQTGMPVARSLCISYPFENKVYDKTYQYEFFFGEDILVAPVTPSETVKKIYLPEGTWYNLYDDQKLPGNTEFASAFPVYQLPLYVKASAIIPLQSLIQSTKERPHDTLFVHLFYGDEKNVFTYYEDDGATMEYQQGSYYQRQMIFDPGGRKFIIGGKEGSYTSRFKCIQLILHGFESVLNKPSVNNKIINVTTGNIRILDALDGLEDYYDKDYYKSLGKAEAAASQKLITIVNSDDDIIFQW